MKNILLFIVSLVIFLPLSTLARCITNTPNNNQVLVDVLDSNCNPLNTSNRYFLLPSCSTIEGGGIRLADLGHQQQNTCPTSVVQSKSVTNNGIRIYFMPKNSKFKKIVVNSPLTIKIYLDYLNLCNDLLVWKLDHFYELLLLKYHTISTGAKFGDPLDLSSWFRIQPVGSYYNLVFCPHEVCYNIGIDVRQSEYLCLALSEDPMVFKFKLYPVIGKAEAC